jgi:hypothetical protein
VGKRFGEREEGQRMSGLRDADERAVVDAVQSGDEPTVKALHPLSFQLESMS